MHAHDPYTISDVAIQTYLPHTFSRLLGLLNMVLSSFRFLLLTLFIQAIIAFVPPQQRGSKHHEVSMAPRFDKKLNKFVPTSPEDGPEAGYPLIGSLLRQGPEPVIQRIINPDDYEQAVLKFMAVEKVDRMEAQGNMDAYLRNANDWAYLRLESERKGSKIDYVTLNSKNIILTVVWSSIVFAVGGRAIVSLTAGESFWQFMY